MTRLNRTIKRTAAALVIVAGVLAIYREAWSKEGSPAGWWMKGELSILTGA